MQIDSVPYTVYEASQARADRRFRLMWILVLVIFIAFVASNIGWMMYESQYEEVITVAQENESGYNNYIGNDGSIINGKASNN